MVQRLVVGDLAPVRMVAPSREMSTVSGWNVAVQPWSQSRPMESREPEERAGKDVGDACGSREMWEIKGGGVGGSDGGAVGKEDGDAR